jgi:beta-glucosidase
MKYPQLGESPVSEVISSMTLEEKINFVLGTGMDFPGLPPEFEGPVVGQAAGRVPGAAGNTFAISRLGIPSVVLADGPAGVRISPTRKGEADTYFCTAFPIATLLASSWDVDMVQKVGAAMGDEAREYGVDILLTPAQNIHRNPLGGRNYEYFSEDPLVSGKVAAAVVKGIQSEGVGTSIKHFVANNHEWNRNTIDVTIDERALREIYLKGFEIAIREANPWTVMSSYNKVNGSYTSESVRLLTTILRDQWGFTGIVVTDWFGGRDPVAQLQAGNDLLMPGTILQQNTLMNAVTSGALKEDVLSRLIANILSIVVQTPVFKKYAYSDKPALEAHATLARQAGAEGMVLLRNQDATLPLARETRVAVFGNSAYEMETGGTGSGDVNKAYTVSLLEGLSNAGYTSHDFLNQNYPEHIESEKKRQSPQKPFMPKAALTEKVFSKNELDLIVAETDVALLTIGRNSGEFIDRTADDDFYLSSEEKILLDEVAHAFHQQGKPLVVILNVGGVIETVSWRDKADAILLAWQPGQEAGHAIADVISGLVNPSGKLATTFAASLGDHPSSQNFPGRVEGVATTEIINPLQGMPGAEINYEDSIWVGYRAFLTQKVRPAYPFGYGLSYTLFEYHDINIVQDIDDKWIISIKVNNKGDVSGREVVQLYVGAPDESMEKPEMELRAFAKTALLAPSASETLQFELHTKDLTSFDVDTGDWVVHAGEYVVHIGASSEDIRARQSFTREIETHIAV